MDWINPHGRFTEHELTTFDYEDDGFDIDEKQSEAKATLITKTVTNEHPVKEPLNEHRFIDNDSRDGLGFEFVEKEWRLSEDSTLLADNNEYLKSPRRSQHSCSESNSLPDKVTLPGFHLILLPRAPEVFPGQPSSVSELPFSKAFWKLITELFRVHCTITRTILREVAYFSALRHTPRETGVLEISYTARMAAAIPNDIALSTAYIPSQNTTYSILYGCNQDQLREVWKRISIMSTSSHHSHMHPLLTMGIFIELERTRLVNSADKLAVEFTLGSDILGSNSWDASANSPKMDSYLRICLRSRTLVDYIRAVKRQLVKVLDELDELEKYWRTIIAAMNTFGTPRNDHITEDDEQKDAVGKRVSNQEQQQQKELLEGLIETGQQMRQRIKDIMDEYDDKTDECKKMTQNLSLAMQTGWNQIARQDSMTSTKISHINTEIAWEAKREGAQMRSIAVLGMIYLPLSCVASVFSTSLFNWNPAEGETVVSSYIWILAAFAAGMTLLTVLAWHLWTRREKKLEEAKKKSGVGLGSGQGLGDGLHDAAWVV
ncbi:hypothetical protein QBC37DRAFT_434311 [Rhypophila decipiens]|uniref:Uncharacterized protein n=1 Tax=Rhypophila decipiens TaxID=261697 RepID=A0AAN6XUI8_9PEZI|nr:hypothetical protein QBC37DRAFT_434311 [Rhypophila decipiens]